MFKNILFFNFIIANVDSDYQQVIISFVAVFKKCLWITVSMVTLTVLILHMYHIIAQYLSYDTTTEITVIPVKRHQFPGTLRVFI